MTLFYQYNWMWRSGTDSELNKENGLSDFILFWTSVKAGMNVALFIMSEWKSWLNES
jgi:hypothetical protein